MGGGGGYFPKQSKSLDDLLSKAKAEAEAQKQELDVNEMIQELLVAFNDRDTESTRDKLDEISHILGDDLEFEKLMFGGSVAKHTYVDGLSDIDALAVLDRAEYASMNPEQVLERVHQLLATGLIDGVEEVKKGTLAVTVTYRDGSEVQVLPAIRKGDEIAISDPSGTEWRATKPKEFAGKLTRANQELGGCLVPMIKLAKSINDGLPEQKRLSGHHVEALAIEAFEGYKGPRAFTSLLRHFYDQAPKLVMSPITDVTCQSANVDSALGTAESTARRLAADALESVGRKIGAGASADTWREIISG